MSVTPFFWQFSHSEDFMALEALEISGWLAANTLAEQLHATTGAGTLDDRCLEFAAIAKTLGNNCRKRVNRG